MLQSYKINMNNVIRIMNYFVTLQHETANLYFYWGEPQ